MSKRPMHVALAVLLALPLAAAAQQPAPADPMSPFAPQVAERLQALAALNLTPQQRMSLLAIARDAAALRTSIASGVDAALAAADAELASPDADLHAMAAASEAAVDTRLAEVRVLRDRLIDFYHHELDAEQQALARELLRARLQALSRLRDALLALRGVTQLSQP